MLRSRWRAVVFLLAFHKRRRAFLHGHPLLRAWVNKLGKKLLGLSTAMMLLGWFSVAPKEPDTLCTQEKFMHVGMCVYISAQLRRAPVPPAADLCSRDTRRGKFFASIKVLLFPRPPFLPPACPI